MKRVIIGLLIIAGIAAVGAAGYLGFASAQKPQAEPAVRPPATVDVTRGSVEQTITAPGQVVSKRELSLGMSVSGKLAQLNAQPGETVKTGDVLAQADTVALAEAVEKAKRELALVEAQVAQSLEPASKAEIDSAKAQLSKAGSHYQEVKAGPTASDIEQALRTWNGAKNSLYAAQVQRDALCGRDKGGYECHAAEAGVGTAYELERAAYDRYQQAQQPPTQEQLGQAGADVAAARANLNKLMEGPSETDQTIGQLKIEQARAAVANAEDDLKQAALVSPCDCVVLDVKAREGDVVQSGASLFIVADLNQLEIRATVIEEDLPNARVGMEVQVFLDAAPDAEIKGNVSRIVPQRQEGDRPLYPVYIEVDGLPEGIAPGMSADASLIVNQVDNALRLPKSVVRGASGGTARVEVWDGAQREQRTIKVGLRGDTYVEILDGLDEGEQVVAE